MQVGSTVQFHVAPPFIDTSFIPDGTASVDVTVPFVGPAVAPLLTVTVYVAPFCPCLKLPVWAFVMLKDRRVALV